VSKPRFGSHEAMRSSVQPLSIRWVVQPCSDAKRDMHLRVVRIWGHRRGQIVAMRHPRDVGHALRACLRIAGHVQAETPGPSRNVELERGKLIPAGAQGTLRSLESRLRSLEPRAAPDLSRPRDEPKSQSESV
jgi:hypothetical protein